MHDEILTENQIKLLGLLPVFKDSYYLAGGTALALQIGHRRSIDFDLLTEYDIEPLKIREKIRRFNYSIETTIESTREEYTIVTGGVKITFLHYPFNIEHNIWFDNIITMPDILTISAMKAYTIGRRGKWKDYVDFYFVFKYHYKISDVVQKARQIFSGEFNERLFREQLCYYDDIDYSEEVEYLGQHPSVEEIKEFLINVATEINLEDR